MTIRPIKPSDNLPLLQIIKSCLEEFEANLPGTVYYDDETAHLYEVFKADKSAYFVAEEDGKIYGGSGIFPSDEFDYDTIELVKMYLLPEARGKQVGQMLLEACSKQAQANGYKKLYLETMPQLKNAIAFYEKNNFKYLNHPQGNTGHDGCGLWMIKSII